MINNMSVSISWLRVEYFGISYLVLGKLLLGIDLCGEGRFLGEIRFRGKGFLVFKLNIVVFFFGRWVVVWGICFICGVGFEGSFLVCLEF